MASITICNLDDQLEAQLRRAAAAHGHSIEEEVRCILRNAFSRSVRNGLGSRIRERFAAVGGFELEIPDRKDERNVPDPHR